MQYTLRMINRLLTLCFALILPAFAAPSDDVVDRVQARYQQLQSITARFTSRTNIPSLGKTITTTGGLALAKGGKLRIEYATQPPKQYVSDGKTLWTYTDGDSQYSAMTLGAAGLPKDALTFLTGFADLRTLYRIDDAPSDAPATGTTLTLRPKRKTEYDHLVATFRDDGLLTHLAIAQKSGNDTRYEFTDTVVNSVLPAGVFTFTPPADVQAVQ